MKERRWNNQYIELIAKRRDRIFAVKTAEEIADTKSTLLSLRTSYDALIVELGSGSGGHLIEHALKAPRILHLGFELRFKRAYRTIEKAEGSSAENLYMVQGDAHTMFDLFEDESINGIYINFPDPWAKTRWKKHRMLNSSFLEHMHRKLVPGGFFSHKTDHPEYFKETLGFLHLLANAEILQMSDNLHTTEIGATFVKSEFENLFISQGLPVKYVETRKK
jgi:tRNA (guanine-N7-)-methyltransferase